MTPKGVSWFNFSQLGYWLSDKNNRKNNLEESYSGFISTLLPTVHTNKLSIVHDWNIPGNKSLKNSIKMWIKDKLDLVIIFEMKKKSSGIKLPIIKNQWWNGNSISGSWPLYRCNLLKRSPKYFHKFSTVISKKHRQIQQIFSRTLFVECFELSIA